MRRGPDDLECRRDEGRAFERAILDSAPEGLIPASFLKMG